MRGTPRLEPAELTAAGRDVTVPFTLCLTVTRAEPAFMPIAATGRSVTMTCRQILRLLPGRRLVALVDVHGRQAVLKLFLGASAERYRAREARGCQLIASAGVATPAVLAQLGEHEPGTTPARALLFEYLPRARPVSAADDVAVAGAAAELARLHESGCRHHDLHLDNFLQMPAADEEPSAAARVPPRAARVFMIDGDQVRRSGAPRPLGAARSLEDLAVLCAERPPLADAGLAEVLARYAAVRGWPSGPARLEALAEATGRQRRLRMRRYLQKAERECTEFHRHASWHGSLIAVRTEWNEAAAAFAADPEAAFRNAAMLKDGNSTTVVRATIGGHSRVIKRYNLKGPWHTLRRVLKPAARYRLAWLNGQRLHFLGIPTARPLMLLVRRWGPLRGVAYLLMEDLGDVDLAAEVAANGLGEARLAQLVALFRALAAAGLRHGDTKASNFLVTPAGVHLVDLDAMREQRDRQLKDVTRFLANFEHLPEIRARLEAALVPEPGGGFAVGQRPL